MIARRTHPELLLRRWWEEGAPVPMAAALGVLSIGYRLALPIRDRAYRWGLLRSARLPCPVVSVGNITLGGSGKTPTVELAVLTLRDLGARPAVVSRGYGRQSRGVHVVADGEGIRLAPREAGDEPLLLAERLPGVPVVVGENRLEAGRVAIERCGATVLVLDDGFQHRAVDKDLEILVVNGRAPWGNGRLFPRGTLREPLSALTRADLVVMSNPSGAADVEAITAAVRRRNPRAVVVAAAYHAEEAREARAGSRIAAGDLAGKRLLAFAGLGSPRSFTDTLASLGVRVMGLVEFPDHHWYTPGDLADLDRQSRAVRAEGLVTTEKDATRFRELLLPPIPLWVIPVRLALESGHEAWLQALGRTLGSSSARPS